MVAGEANATLPVHPQRASESAGRRDGGYPPYLERGTPVLPAELLLFFTSTTKADFARLLRGDPCGDSPRLVVDAPSSGTTTASCEDAVLSAKRRA